MYSTLIGPQTSGQHPWSSSNFQIFSALVLEFVSSNPSQGRIFLSFLITLIYRGCLSNYFQFEVTIFLCFLNQVTPMPKSTNVTTKSARGLHATLVAGPTRMTPFPACVAHAVGASNLCAMCRL